MHSEQVVNEAPDWLYFPVPHAVQTVPPEMLVKRPEAQAVQTVKPTSEVNVPASQSTQLKDELSKYPGIHPQGQLETEGILPYPM